MNLLTQLVQKVIPGIIILVLMLIVIVPGSRAAQEIGRFEATECWFDKPIPFFPGPEFQCGYVIVPERHENPNGPTIRIPVAVARASSDNPRPDPLFMAQGGPGGDAFEVFPIMLGASSIWQDRDVVVFNQRGTRYAEPDLSCTESFDAAAEVLGLPDEEADERSLAILQDCYDRLIADGVNVSAFNSLQNAADVDVIRQALGFDEYNFYGVSYGTLLGLHLLREHPEHVRSVILDGVVPTDLNFTHLVAANTDRVFTEIFNTCAQDPECNRQYPNLEERFFAVVEELNESPVSMRLKDPESGQRADVLLDGDTLVDVLFQAFYLPDSYAYFPKLVLNLENGDMTFIEGLWPLIAFDRTISEGMYFSVLCAEDGDFDPSKLVLEGIRPYFAERAGDELQSYSEACEIWRVDQLPAAVNEPVTADKPVLLLSGHYDPITPPSFAEVASASLVNDLHLIDPTGSHGVAFGDLCLDSILKQFMNAPDQDPDTSCLSEIEFKQFAPADAISFPFVGELNQLSDAVIWQIGLATLFLIVVLSAFVVLPLAWFIRVLSTKERPPESPSGIRLRRIGGVLILLFGFLAVIFATGTLYFTFDSIFSGLASIFAISRSAAPLFTIPPLLLLIASAMVVITFYAWRRGYWSTLARVYFTIISIASAAYVVVLSAGGMMTLLL